MGTLLNSYRLASAGIPYTYTKSLNLGGTNQYVDFGDQSAMDGAASFSLAAWVKFDTTGTFEIIFAKTAGGAIGNPGWQLTKDGADRLRFIISDGSGVLNVFTTDTLSSATWYLVGVSTDGSTAAGTTIYIDGSAGTMNTSSDTLSGSVLNTQPVTIGRRGDGFYMNGKAFSAGFYTGSLTSGNWTSIAALSPKDLSAGPGTLIFYPRFGNDPLDDATGGTGVIKDRVGGFDGTPQNTVAGDIVTDAP